jgi:chaperonin cofactor prefoldin
MMNRIKVLSKELSSTALSRKALESQLKELQAMKAVSGMVDAGNPVGIYSE